ncbi:MAG TPA: Xaa-Pro peptidase family protein [Thermoanaerobaculia bacterium]|jgi:Xaa-Pro dipeptidase|nr:Xaa-Pro peptidase family protein [Thermoanaerobaculia bacterium]
MTLSRRRLLQLTGAATVASLPASRAAAEEGATPAPLVALTDRTKDVAPISLDEHRARLARAQKLLADSGLQALVVGPGTGLNYFTGARWGLSERFFGMVLTAGSEPSWVTPAFEQRRAEEQIQIGKDVRAWQEDESPFALVATVLKDRGVATGKVGLEETLPFAFADGIAKALPGATLASGTPVTGGCRMIKDAHELAIMRKANEITVRAHRAVFQSLREGMSHDEAAGLTVEAHKRQGVEGGSLILFGPDAAFPHGTTKPRTLAAGDIVLIDGGCTLHGYASDITRTGVFGKAPTARQREVWELVRKAQDAAFRTVRPGVECQAVDAAARQVLTDGGFGPGYKFLTHRLGHGIGMDGHEHTYLVRGNTTKLQPGMCFSDEPGIYIPGELGIRHEDIFFVTAEGAENMTRWTGPPEDPAVV